MLISYVKYESDKNLKNTSNKAADKGYLTFSVEYQHLTTIEITANVNMKT